MIVRDVLNTFALRLDRGAFFCWPAQAHKLIIVYLKEKSMENLSNKDTGHSLVLMTSKSFQEALEDVFVRAKEAALAEIDARTRADEDRVITKQEAMHMLDKSANTMWKWARRGYLVPVKIGGRVLYKMSDINRIMGWHDEK